MVKVKTNTVAQAKHAVIAHKERQYLFLLVSTAESH